MIDILANFEQFRKDGEISFEMDCSSFDSNTLFELLGVNTKPNTVDIVATHEVPYKTQIKKHHKKRINKKWAKRYGYSVEYKKVETTFYNVQIM